MLKIELAQGDDVAEIVALGYASFKENKVSKFNILPDFDKSLLKVSEFILNDTVFIHRSETTGKIEGVFITDINETWYSNKPILFSVLYYVKPDKRNFPLAKALINAAKEYAIINSLPIVIDLFAQKDVKQKGKLLKYLGFEECGSFYILKEKV